MKICKKCSSEFEGENIYCNKCRWEMKWSSEILNAPELASRRKRSHNLNLISLNLAEPQAVFLSDSKDGRLKGNTYVTNLTKCTCTDFLRGHGKHPCKHIFRLAEELGLFSNEKFEANEHDYTLRFNFADIPLERKILPEELHFASDELVEKYITILRFIYRGRKIRIEKLEKILADLNEGKERTSYREKLNMWLGFRDEARKIKRYKFVDEYDENLEHLVNIGLIELQNTEITTTVKIPDTVTINRIENILELYGQYLPVFFSEVTKNPLSTLTEILKSQKRSEKILRPYDALNTPNWKFRVPSCFNDALDIRLVSRTKNLVEYAAWTQGINFAFDAGDMLYRDQDTYEKGTPALQIITSRKAQGTKMEKLNKGIDGQSETVDESIETNIFEGYYPGEVIYRDFEAGDIKTTTQMDFVKMLIGINANG